MTDIPPFSAIIRERADSAHSDSESSGFMTSLLRGDGTRDDYAALVAQHYFIYKALEGVAERLQDDPVASAFITDRLTRLPALEADLAFLFGADWRDEIAPLPSTQRYVERIEETADWAGGFVAHHYTRYLGDLSGGIFIGKAMQRRFGFERDGVGFYTFDEIDDPNVFKDEYRTQLNLAPWDDAEKERVIEEVLLAYRFNSEVFADLVQAKRALVA